MDLSLNNKNKLKSVKNILLIILKETMTILLYSYVFDDILQRVVIFKVYTIITMYQYIKTL